MIKNHIPILYYYYHNIMSFNILPDSITNKLQVDKIVP